MSATNATTNYSLPLFLGSDKPAWLVDWNGAMSAIDTAIKNAADSASQAGTDISALTLTVGSLSDTVTNQGTALGNLTTTVGGLSGSVNTINSLIGNGEPTTTDKTLIGAINELYDDIHGGGPSSVTAANVTYDNTSSGMTADDVQEAIDELQSEITNLPTPSGGISEKGSHVFTLASANTSVTEAITFTGTYVNEPTVIASISTFANDSGSGIIQSRCAVSGVTNTGCNLVAISSEANAKIRVAYIVISND